MEWQMGQRADGKDSIARQVAPESHWPELRVLILVVSGSRAETASPASAAGARLHPAWALRSSP